MSSTEHKICFESTSKYQSFCCCWTFWNWISALKLFAVMYYYENGTYICNVVMVFSAWSFAIRLLPSKFLISVFPVNVLISDFSAWIFFLCETFNHGFFEPKFFAAYIFHVRFSSSHFQQSNFFSSNSLLLYILP